MSLKEVIKESKYEIGDSNIAPSNVSTAFASRLSTQAELTKYFGVCVAAFGLPHFRVS